MLSTWYLNIFPPWHTRQSIFEDTSASTGSRTWSTWRDNRERGSDRDEGQREEERGRNKMGYARDWEKTSVEGAKEMHLAWLSMTATLCRVLSIHKQRELFLYTKPKAIPRLTRCSLIHLVSFRIYSRGWILLSNCVTRMKFKAVLFFFLQCHDTYFEEGRVKNQTHRN